MTVDKREHRRLVFIGLCVGLVLALPYLVSTSFGHPAAAVAGILTGVVIYFAVARVYVLLQRRWVLPAGWRAVFPLIALLVASEAVLTALALRFSSSRQAAWTFGVCLTAGTTALFFAFGVDLLRQRSPGEG